MQGNYPPSLLHDGGEGGEGGEGKGGSALGHEAEEGAARDGDGDRDSDRKRRGRREKERMQEEERLLRKGRRGADARKTDEEQAHEFAYQWLHIRKSSI